VSLLEWLLNQVVASRRRRVDVRLRIHRADLVMSNGQRIDAYFLNVWNASPERDVQVTHVWIEAEPHVAVLTKPLPVDVRAGRQWETYVAAADLPAGLIGIEQLGRAQLADGTIVVSDARQSVPPAGAIPDG
jgi:hypothetical protein